MYFVCVDIAIFHIVGPPVSLRLTDWQCVDIAMEISHRIDI